MTNNKKAEAILVYLKSNHVGKAKAISGKRLETDLNISGRSIRRGVSALRQQKVPICSDGTGYYYASTQEEINNSIGRLNSLVLKISNSRNGLLYSSVNTKVIKLHIEIEV